jgi:hypothetical protein
MKPIAAAICLLAGALTGCVPLPYVERSAPEIHGGVSDDATGHPLGKLEVKRITNFTEEEIRQGQACKQDGDITETDASGDFHFRSTWRFLPVIPLYGDPIWQVLICMPNNGTDVPVWRGGHIGRTPSHLTLGCRAQSAPDGRSMQCQLADALCLDFARRARSSPETGRYFGNIASGVRDSADMWKEFPSNAERFAARTDDNLNEVADVWTFPGEGSFVRMVFTSPSGDWDDYVDYCFRSDGSLSAIDAELRTFYGNMIVNRSWLFDPDGRKTGGPMTYRDLQTKQPTDAKGKEGLGFQNHDVPEYMSTKALPFWSE